MAADNVDYDKQFQEDLERAQALSLESLALEQFRHQKRLRDLDISQDEKQNRSTSVSRASSITESDLGKRSQNQIKSRPRPGTVSGAQTNSIIAPPPSFNRRNSTSTTCSDVVPNDLISFTNPPPSNTLIDLCQQLHNALNKPSSTNSVPFIQHQLSAGNSANLLLQTNYRPQWSNNFANGNVVPTVLHTNLLPTMDVQLPIMSQNNSLQNPLRIITNPPYNAQQNVLVNSASSTSVLSAAAVPVKNLISAPVANLPNKHKRNPSNLIDLGSTGFEDRNSVRVSILEAFDPLLSNDCDSVNSLSPEYQGDDTASVCGSVYDEYDPYDFIYTNSSNNSISDPMYAAVVKSDNAPLSPPPPLPPRAQKSSVHGKSRELQEKRKIPLYENISVVDQKTAATDSSLRAFHSMIQRVRNQFCFDDPDTNMGLIISPLVNHQYREGTSIKLCVFAHYEGADFSKPVTFTCDVTSSVEHITMHVTCELEAPNKDQYTLKVWGYNEYLAPTTLLSDYEYIHNCIKLEVDVRLILIPDRAIDRSFARTVQDDNRDRDIKLEDIIPKEPISPITHDNLKILLETLEKEMEKLEQASVQIENTTNASMMPPLHSSGVVQSVKLVVKLMGTFETPEITEALDSLKDACTKFLPHPNQLGAWTPEPLSEMVNNACKKIYTAIQGLLEMYTRAFRVNFSLKNQLEAPLSTISVAEVSDSFMLKIAALYRPLPEWKHDSYMIAAQIYHGTRHIRHPVLSQPSAVVYSLYPRILFNHWLDLDIPICSLAKEARLVLVIYGRTLQQPESGDNSNTPQYKQEELGWAAVQLFNYEGFMMQGTILLSIWPKESCFIYGPAPSSGTHPYPDHPVLGIEIATPSKIIYPPVPAELTSQFNKMDFYSLDLQTQQQLIEISEQDMLFKPPLEAREILWEKRNYLHSFPDALPKVLLAAHSWEWAYLPNLHGLLHAWKPMRPSQAIQLLLPTFPDTEVRKYAVKWLQGISHDELVDYLPQLVVALRHELYEDSPLAEFLLDRALRSPRVAHHLFWLLSHNLPGSMPQNFSFDFCEKDPSSVSEARYYRRIMLLLRALLAICGESLRKCFISQQLLMKDLNEIAENVQKSKESQRLSNLQNNLEMVHQSLRDNPTSLPLSPSLRIEGIDCKTSAYFPSNTLPLKINFLAFDGTVIPAIYKVGDDLQQDMLTLQIVRLMDKMWLKEGLDLKIVTFACVPTGKKRGVIEMITEAETLRKIQVEHGLTGSFKDKPIAEWLAKHNPSELEYERARENFTASCAGYCVVTYVLGICDRHNDNIMLKTSGHLFHIDFGKFLGDAQMFGNFKRDRTPFVLTSDMAYVINGGDRASEKFHKFVDLCCQAFNIVRNNGNLFLHLFTLMASSGMRGVTTEAVSNLHKALLPGMSNAEAAAYFARLIESSLKSWFTQFNFFIHNLAQLKFTGDHGDNQLLSFVPKTYSMATDGRLTHVAVIGYRKRYDPDKYYVYILRVEREGQPNFMDLYRTYKEFCELHQKLCLHFPLAKLHSPSSGLHMGRSNIKQVASKRYYDISHFISSLFQTADEICHSDLVYTFFHPLLRDQQFPDHFGRKFKDRRIEERSEIGRLKGQLKLSILFSRGVLSVMVHHARGLPLVGNSQEPSTYVKVYLQPDPIKTTKRKTKVVKRNCHPSFMEMLEYRMALDIIKKRTLRATVWNHDPLQENEFLGGVDLELDQFDLTKEMTEWYPLTNLSR